MGERPQSGQVLLGRNDAAPIAHRRGSVPRPAAAMRVKAVGRQSAAFQIVPGGNVLILADQAVIQQLELARKLLDRKQYANAVLLLQRVVERDRDAFYYPDPLKRKLLKSVRLSAQRMIGSLPEGGRNAYRLKYAVTARQELAAAYKTGNPAGIAAVARKFFHTTAGYEAMYRMGTIHFDRSQPLAAALCFEKVRKIPSAAKRWEPMLSLRTAISWHHAGFVKKSRQALDAVKRIQGNRPLMLGGRRVPIFANPADGPAWLARTFRRPASESGRLRSGWTVFRGGPSRNPITDATVRLPQKSWRMNTVLDLDDRRRSGHVDLGALLNALSIGTGG
ncbi:MAG: hypothetical protein IID45_11825 [Planctomycetes bacterium]|nr:hypothetical protein [Planctomycetota bacterium]